MNKFNVFKQDLSELYSDKVPINLSPSLSLEVDVNLDTLKMLTL